MRRTALLALSVSLILGACSQTPLAPPLAPTATTAMPLPAFSNTFSGSFTRGFWFQAPVDFRITSLKVPDESGHGLQNVEVIRLSSAPASFPGTSTGEQLFYKTGVPSGEVIKANLAVQAGDYIGVLGAAGDAAMMHNSYGNGGDFTSSILGQDVVLKRFLTQSNLVASGGNQPVSTESGGSIARVEVYVVPTEAVAPTITLTTPADGASYTVGDTVTASYSCADEESGSGLESCTGPVADGAALDTSTPGSYSFTVNAEDSAGNKTAVTHSYTVNPVPPPAPVADSYVIDFEAAPTNTLVYSVKLGSGVLHQSGDTPSSATVPVVGKRRGNGTILQAQLAKVVNVYGSDRLVIAYPGNTPAAQGGRVKLTFTNFDPEGVTLTSLTLSNLVAKGAYLTFYYADGSSSRQNLGTTPKGGSLVVPLEVKGLRAVDVFAPSAFAVDDVTFVDEPDLVTVR